MNKISENKRQSKEPQHAADPLCTRVWEERFVAYFSEHVGDAAHDLGHFRRVASVAAKIASFEATDVDLLIILAAAYFHDIVSLPKNHPDNRMSSRLAAVKARTILEKMSFPSEKLEGVSHAIEAHSYSAQIEPQTKEAKIIQDADRMEALGAIGILRTFYISGCMQIPPFDPCDVCAKNRPLNDKMFGLDHFYCKLFKLSAAMQTKGGGDIAQARNEFMHIFVKELIANIQLGIGGALEIVRICCKAGQDGIRLFDPIDPFASQRQFCFDQFVVDRLLESKLHFPQFLSFFLEQLEKELR